MQRGQARVRRVVDEIGTVVSARVAHFQFILTQRRHHRHLPVRCATQHNATTHTNTHKHTISAQWTIHQAKFASFAAITTFLARPKMIDADYQWHDLWPD